MNQVDAYYLNKKEPYQSCLLALRVCILEQDSKIIETQKWDMPCFVYKTKGFCYLWTDKKTQEPYILFVEGKYLDYPQLEKGARSKMKILRINPNIDLPIQLIEEIINSALNLYRNGTLKTK